MRQVRSARISKAGLSALIVIALGAVVPIARSQVPNPHSTDAPRTEAKEKPKEKDRPATKAAPSAKGSKARSKSADEMPMVMSTEALARLRGTSTLDKARYDGEPDWSQVPTWRQASFFGIRAQGQLFLYVVDCSGSMDDEDRLDRAKAELRRSVSALQSPQRFKVIFYNDRPVPMPGDLPKPADSPSKAQLSRWLNLVQAEGPTDPKASVAQALAFKPDAVFLLSDGAFPEGTAESIAKLNAGKIPIHCVDLANGAAGAGLRRIAGESGGQYVTRGR
jgi:hypothetical protein